MAGNAWRDSGGAREALGTGDGVVCSGAGRSELKLICKIRAAWAGWSGLRRDPDASWTLRSYHQVCMRCLWGYLVCTGGQLVLLLDASWRGKWTKLNYGGKYQIWSRANYFQA